MIKYIIITIQACEYVFLLSMHQHQGIVEKIDHTLLRTY